jgi:hypothetical protein
MEGLRAVIIGIDAYLPWRDEYSKLADPARYPMSWLDEQVARGSIRAWAVPTAGMLAEVRVYPGGLREAHCMAAAGELAGILELKPIVEAWGRIQGCGEAVVESRIGWAKVLKDYRMHQVSIRKVL